MNIFKFIGIGHSICEYIIKKKKISITFWCGAIYSFVVYNSRGIRVQILPEAEILPLFKILPYRIHFLIFMYYKEIHVILVLCILKLFPNTFFFLSVYRSMIVFKWSIPWALQIHFLIVPTQILVVILLQILVAILPYLQLSPHRKIQPPFP